MIFINEKFYERKAWLAKTRKRKKYIINHIGNIE